LQAARALRESIPAGSREPLRGVSEAPGRPSPPEPPPLPQPVGCKTETECAIPELQLQTVQMGLCVNPTGRFDPDTREAIRQAKLGARLTNLDNNEIKSRTELQTFRRAIDCKDKNKNTLGWATAFEQFRFNNRAAIKELSRQLKGCERNLQESDMFDQTIRNAIRAIKTAAPEAEKQKFGEPNLNALSNTLNNASYTYIRNNCIP
jgi:hypothetical protein